MSSSNGTIYEIELSYLELKTLDKFLTDIGVDHQEFCRKVFDRVYHDDFIYVETIDHDVYIFKIKGEARKDC